jgi:crotonobetainyl-CoA:carnitine CoA-transferase CaiB-like acyl-CoA transferase
MTELMAPLAGVRVLDIATFLAAPFCGVILADFGAEVIKIEQPGVGDPLRRFGTPAADGDTLTWISEARNKKFVTLDLRTAEGAELFRQLVAKSDVVLENFRPGTLEKWGLGFESLQRVNPKLVMLSVSAYGQNGPWSKRPGFARIAHGFSGLSYLAGEPDGRPVVPGSTSIADYISGMWGAIGVLLALRVVERSGLGQRIDIGLYESVFRLMDELVPAYTVFGKVRERLGPDVDVVVPHGHWQTGDGKWLALACSSDKMFERLAAAMGKPEIAGPENFATNAARVAHRKEVNTIVAEWMKRMTRDEALEVCDRAEVPCGPLLRIDEIMRHPQYLARENFFVVDDPRLNDLMLPSQPLRLSATPAKFSHTGGRLGEHTDSLLGALLGLSVHELRRLNEAKVI